jgi:hypothetical protein
MWFMFGFGLSAASAEFFVNPTGNDNNDGKSAKSAWKTVAKVNAASFAPGDVIRFARGGEWHESLKASSSGASGSPIVYDAFGDEKLAKPKFWGSEVLVNANFKDEGNHVYSYAIKEKVRHVLADHALGAKGCWFALADEAKGKKVEATPNGFFWKDGVLRIHCDSDPRTDGRVYTGCLREDIVHSNAKNFLVFRNLVADESANAFELGYCFRVMGSADVRLEDCEAYRAGIHHFGTINSTRFVGLRLYTAYTMPAEATATFYVSFSDPSRKDDEHVWDSCVAEHLENPGRRNHMAIYNHGPGVGNLTIKNLTSRGGMVSCGQDTPATHVKLIGGLLDNAPLEMFASDVLVDGLTLRGPNAVIDIYGSNNMFQNIRLLDVEPKNGGPTGYNAAFLCRDKALNNTLRFSTIVLKHPDATCIVLTGKENQASWYGNIFQGKKALWLPSGGFSAANMKRVQCNLYSAGATFEGQDFAGWQSRGLDKDSLTGDAGVDADGKLKAGSPAIDAAKAIEAASIPPADALGAKRPAGAAADLGAMEFVK